MLGIESVQEIQIRKQKFRDYRGKYTMTEQEPPPGTQPPIACKVGGGVAASIRANENQVGFGGAEGGPICPQRQPK